MSESTLRFTETDEAGIVTATYVQTKTSETRVARIDHVVRNILPPKSDLQQLTPPPEAQRAELISQTTP